MGAVERPLPPSSGSTRGSRSRVPVTALVSTTCRTMAMTTTMTIRTHPTTDESQAMFDRTRDRPSVEDRTADPGDLKLEMDLVRRWGLPQRNRKSRYISGLGGSVPKPVSPLRTSDVGIDVVEDAVRVQLPHPDVEDPQSELVFAVHCLPEDRRRCGKRALRRDPFRAVEVAVRRVHQHRRVADVRRSDEATLDVVVALPRDAGQARVRISVGERGRQVTVLAHRAASDVELCLDPFAHGVEVRAIEAVVLVVRLRLLARPRE